MLGVVGSVRACWSPQHFADTKVLSHHQAKVEGSQAKVEGSQAKVEGSQAKVEGATPQAKVEGSTARSWRGWSCWWVELVTG